MKILLNILLLATFTITILFPNAFQVLSFSLLVATNVILFLSGFIFTNNKLRLLWLVLSIFFVLWIWISAIPFDDKLELFVKYVVSPFLWINICDYVFKTFTKKLIVKYLFNYFMLCSITVILLYVLTSLGYENITGLFVSNVNIDQVTGLGFVLHIYGSMIFFVTAFIPILILSHRNSILKIVSIILVIIAIILSGRTALFLAMFLGVLTFLLKYKRNYQFSFKSVFFIFLTITAAYFVYLNIYEKFFEIDLLQYFIDVHFSKVEESGGSVRTEQLSQILDAIYKNPFGEGFITLNIIRDLNRTYNYEMLTIITLMRFGVIVTLLIVYSIKKILFYALSFRRSKNYFADIMFLGFIGIVIASFTNPYLESFSFQWMFFAPLIYFFNHYERNFSK